MHPSEKELFINKKAHKCVLTGTGTCSYKRVFKKTEYNNFEIWIHKIVKSTKNEKKISPEKKKKKI